jgi:serine/threonine protein kinase
MVDRVREPQHTLVEDETVQTDEGLVRGDGVDRYVILDRLGAGGMGVVYAAYDPELDRKVAIKQLRGDASEQPTLGRTRLAREARAMAQLSHPNVVTVHDVGESRGAVFIAMEFVEGRTLRDWLARIHHGRRSCASISRPRAGSRPLTLPGWSTATSSPRT